MVATLAVVVDGTTEEGLREGAKRVLAHVRPHWQHPNLTFKVPLDEMVLLAYSSLTSPRLLLIRYTCHKLIIGFNVNLTLKVLMQR